jgi:hypothetical protein
VSCQESVTTGLAALSSARYLEIVLLALALALSLCMRACMQEGRESVDRIVWRRGVLGYAFLG